MLFKNNKQSQAFDDLAYDNLLKSLAEQGPIFHDDKEDDR